MSIEPVITAKSISLAEHACVWFGALWRAECIRGDACHANLLAWLVALPAGLDPAAAARAVIAHQQRETNLVLSTALTILLQEVARYPSERLQRLRPSRRHRMAAH